MNVDLVARTGAVVVEGAWQGNKSGPVKPGLIITLPDRQQRKSRDLVRLDETDRLRPFHSSQP